MTVSDITIIAADTFGQRRFPLADAEHADLVELSGMVAGLLADRAAEAALIA